MIVTDRELADRVRRRDPEAFATLHHHYAALVFWTVRHVVRDSLLAEDLTQEVFLRVWRHSECYDEQRGELASWLAAIATNVSIDHLRKHQRSNVLLRISLLPYRSSSSALFMAAEQHAQDDELMRRVRRAVANLPRTQQECLQSAYWEGLTQCEIAKRTTRPLGTIKSTLRSALRQLRRDPSLQAV